MNSFSPAPIGKKMTKILCVDYSLITYLHIFEYELAASSHVSIPFQAIVQTQNFVF